MEGDRCCFICYLSDQDITRFNESAVSGFVKKKKKPFCSMNKIGLESSIHLLDRSIDRASGLLMQPLAFLSRVDVSISVRFQTG